MKERIQVRLKADLTRYREGLVAGSEGYTVGSFDMWSRGSDRFVGVHFPTIGTLDVLWDSLEIIDEEYLRKVEEYKRKRNEELKTARNIVKYIGPRGGFRSLSYQYTDSNGTSEKVSSYFKDQAEELIKLFEEYGIPVQTVKEG